MKQKNSSGTKDLGLFTELNNRLMKVIMGFLSSSELIRLMKTSKALLINNSELLEIIRQKIEQPYAIKQIVVGFKHTLALLQNGTVWACGHNVYGQLGLGNNDKANALQWIEDLSNVKQIAAGGFHSLALLQNGTVWACGLNNSGQLGLGYNVNQNTPQQITGLYNVKQIAAGLDHSVALMHNGTVRAWGRNNYGQLGLGHNVNRNTPQQITGLDNVTQIAAGVDHSVALMQNGTVWVWGLNNSGQLGLGRNVNQNTPQITGLDNVKQIAAGGLHSVALMQDGTVWVCGFNDFGQLGLGNRLDANIPQVITCLDNVEQVVAGMYHTLAFTQNGTVCAWGKNFDSSLDYLDLGDDAPVINRPKKIKYLSDVKQLVVGYQCTFVFDRDGNVRVFGGDYCCELDERRYKKNQPGQVVTIPNLKKWQDFLRKISRTKNLGFFTGLNNGSMKVIMGFLSSGELIRLMKTSKALLINNSELLEIIIQKTKQSYAIKQIVARELHSVEFRWSALMQNGTVWEWCNNKLGQLGLGYNLDAIIPERITGLDNVAQLVAGGNHTLARTKDGKVFAWGSNTYGQLGLGNNTEATTPQWIEDLSSVKQVVAGMYHMLALVRNGTVWAWGLNNSGQLGLGHNVNQNTPQQITGLDNVKQIAAGVFHSVALMQNGDVWVWGCNDYGQLGLGSNSFAVCTPQQVTVLTSVKLIAAGEYHSLALVHDDNDTLWAWGCNSFGQLGLGNNLDANIPQVITCLDNVVQLFADHRRTVALKQNGTVWVWGCNYSGALGLEHKILSVNRPQMIEGLSEVKQLVQGHNCTFAFDQGGNVRVFGGDYCGQLNVWHYRNQPRRVAMIPHLEKWQDFLRKKSAQQNQGDYIQQDQGDYIQQNQGENERQQSLRLTAPPISRKPALFFAVLGAAGGVFAVHHFWWLLMPIVASFSISFPIAASFAAIVGFGLLFAITTAVQAVFKHYYSQPEHPVGKLLHNLNSTKTSSYNVISNQIGC